MSAAAAVHLLEARRLMTRAREVLEQGRQAAKADSAPYAIEQAAEFAGADVGLAVTRINVALRKLGAAP